MVFSSPLFLFLFLPITLLLYFSSSKLQTRNTILLVMSLLFYAWGEGGFFLVMVFSIIWNYWFGIKISDSHESQKKKWLVTSIILNLSVLIYFKYSGFIVSNLGPAFALLGGAQPKIPDIHLPAGVSFFTFHALSYLVDVYRGHFKAQKNPINLGLYIALFPQLIAGPIVRYEHIGLEIEERNHKLDYFSYGAQRFVIGLAKKILIADTFALGVDKIFALPTTDISTPLAWIGIIFYTLQIYFDFSGYSDMAIGMAKMFGFNFRENFNYPYISTSITEFWRRWHISLSSWFRDYLYIPMGGNRVSSPRQYFNLFTVFFLCGLWHGASWTFVIWGLLHGVLLIIDKLFLLDLFKRIPKVLQHSYVLLMVMISWVFFRADNLSFAVKYIGIMFGIDPGAGHKIPLPYLLSNHVLLVLGIGLIAATPIFKLLKLQVAGTAAQVDTFEPTSSKATITFAACFLLMVFLLSLSSVADNTFNPFIYYRF